MKWVFDGYFRILGASWPPRSTKNWRKTASKNSAILRRSSMKSFPAKLQNQVLSLNLEDKITFAGARRDIANIYKISNIVFNLSQTPEPFGRTMIEAIACGTKVVGWDHGGASEILSALFPQGLVTLNDMNELLETTNEVAISNSLPKENIFTADRMTNSTIDLYLNLIN